MLQKFFLQLFALAFATVFFVAGFASANEISREVADDLAEGAALLAEADSKAAAQPAAQLMSRESHQANVLQDLIRAELARRYPGSRIEIMNSAPLQGALPASLKGVRILSETSKGEAQFSAYGDTSETAQSQGWVSFAAWTPTRVASRRIHPGEKLSPELFLNQEVNVATGLAREYRGIMLSKDAELSRLEARQTILEGQYALTNGVQKVPDVKRGESIVIKMLAGEIALTTQGTAQEPAYVDGPVRVLTMKTKRELVGQLKTGGIVEVKL